MIARIEGTLESLDSATALIQVEGGLTYEVLLPAYTSARLGGSIGEPVSLHTLQYFESHDQGTTLLPRLAGFATRDDRAFFELFTTCKGIGRRRGLRAMTLATSQLAGAIADRDAALLQSLPEVGKRTAETIIATLREKVDRFMEPAAAAGEGETPGGPGAPARGGVAREALDVLVQLGENRAQALIWVDQAMAADDNEKPDDVQALISEVYRIKEGRV